MHLNLAFHQSSERKIGFLGTGSMAAAMIQGFLAKGVVSRSNVMSSVCTSDAAEVSARVGVEVCKDNARVASFADIIIIAVKVGGGRVCVNL